MAMKDSSFTTLCSTAADTRLATTSGLFDRLKGPKAITISTTPANVSTSEDTSFILRFVFTRDDTVHLLLS